jgi:uroporphyrinogen decarboxylase
MPASPNFSGLRVAAFESRRAEDMARLIERHGGMASVSPSMREAALERDSSAVDFARRVVAGQIDVVIFMTGVGFRRLLNIVQEHVGREKYLGALARCVTIVRGPKPLAAMKEIGLTPTHRVGEPNTWREVLGLIDAHVPVAGRTVAVQEYGKPNPQLAAGLTARGANVVSVEVYRWDFPEDTAPLEQNVRALAAGERDVALFTSAQQVVNVLEMARQLGVEAELRDATRRMIIASIGPTTSEMLREQELPVDLEPEHSKMGHLVAAAAERAGELLETKRQSRGSVPRTEYSVRSTPAIDAQSTKRQEQGTKNEPTSPFLRACRRLPTNVTPIWLMRQAGRYLPEYREIRAKTTFLELCKNPQLCAEVMIRTVERLKVDAAIIFSDLLPILEPMGLDLEFLPGEGPAIHNPVREPADVDRVRELESVEPLDFVMQTVRATRAGLPEAIPLIGFAGAPFTLASYVIEGGASRDYAHTKALMYRDEAAWHELLGRLARAVTRYLNAQIAAGAEAVQLFDSWAGCLHPDDYRGYVLPHTRAVMAGVTGVPVINFATGNPALLPLMAEAGGDVIGVDWRVRLDDAWRAVGYDRGVQGNLDPAALLADGDEIRRRVKDILSQAAGRPGHIFNLGHGVLPRTPVENVLALVEMVHELSARS